MRAFESYVKRKFVNEMYIAKISNTVHLTSSLESGPLCSTNLCLRTKEDSLNTCWKSLFSPFASNWCPTWISGRERMAVDPQKP